MILTKSVTDILNSSVQAIKSVIPMNIDVKQPSLLTEPFSQHKIGVLIGFTGGVRGRMIVDGEEESFQALGASMFGMPLEGEMLESFAGELGNMIAGNLATLLAQAGHSLDITPPTVIVGQSKMYGFDKALKLPITIENVGDFLVILMIEI
ncbi:chemotaxis protein CheX [Bacillus sp. KH172YL63]|uniref:chemotaxis protein CheX n=1 Tax=Bacillus sp. KH172YL63 TaxID=2709784 RepID=UPI0013E4E26B|nr:chemotaxis protein CheX [Bacillus sp. KH172YL63]BCB04473.1 CheY-P phosphatase CheX [Bacillus sp. KH172YL63]